jgi:hypothetical protein
VDPRTFDGLSRQVSRGLSRRSVVGGSLGASLLAAVGLGDAALANKVKMEQCVPAGQRCGTRKNDPPCRRCCHRYHIDVSGRKKRCACRPAGIECSNSTQCCNSNCENGTCRSASCQAVNVGCAVDTDCCTGICENGTCRSARCRDVGIRCAFNTDCCTGTCTCSFATDCTCRVPGACGQLGDICAGDDDCCSDVCEDFFEAGLRCGEP